MNLAPRSAAGDESLNTIEDALRCHSRLGVGRTEVGVLVHHRVHVGLHGSMRGGAVLRHIGDGQLEGRREGIGRLGTVHAVGVEVPGAGRGGDVELEIDGDCCDCHGLILPFLV